MINTINILPQNFVNYHNQSYNSSIGLLDRITKDYADNSFWRIYLSVYIGKSGYSLMFWGCTFAQSNRFELIGEVYDNKADLRALMTILQGFGGFLRNHALRVKLIKKLYCNKNIAFLKRLEGFFSKDNIIPIEIPFSKPDELEEFTNSLDIIFQSNEYLICDYLRELAADSSSDYSSLETLIKTGKPEDRNPRYLNLLISTMMEDTNEGQWLYHLAEFNQRLAASKN